MKFSYQWLSELVPGLDIEPAALERLITTKTAECEGIERVASDWIIEIDNKSLTHRPDLWGHIGMAREVAAITGRSLRDPVELSALPPGEGRVRVEIEDLALCPRYSALMFENVRVEPSPDQIQARLDSIGLNSINNVVDATNYVLAELPQPMHAFDADKLRGDVITVRAARQGEQLVALNGETYRLDQADLVIADVEGPVALAGVIGGAETAISERTSRIILESANFQPTRVRLTSARHKLRTDASIRFEKSLDPENTIRGLARITKLFQTFAPQARPSGGVTDRGAELRVPAPIVLPLSFVAQKLGANLDRAELVRILTSLGFGISEDSPGFLTVTIPSWRATKDISLKDDLVEEIGRIFGYDNIAASAPIVACVPPPVDPARLYFRRIRSQLAAQGFTEVHNYSFTEAREVERFSFDIATHIAVANPIASNLSHLRRSLLPGIFRNIETNVRNCREFRIFEIGSEIHAGQGNALPNEIPHLAAALYNVQGDEQDFFELKRVLECVFPAARLTAVAARAYEHPARTAEVKWRDTVLGRIFELHPSLLEAVGIEGRAVVLDVDLRTASHLAERETVQYAPLRKYPTSGFDLSVIANLNTPVAEIHDRLVAVAGADLASIEFIRQYAGPPLVFGQKSVSYHLEVGAADHTLTADEATEIRNRIIAGMRQANFELRV